MWDLGGTNHFSISSEAKGVYKTSKENAYSAFTNAVTLGAVEHDMCIVLAFTYLGHFSRYVEKNLLLAENCYEKALSIGCLLLCRMAY